MRRLLLIAACLALTLLALAEPSPGLLVHRPVGAADRPQREAVRPTLQQALEFPHLLRDRWPGAPSTGQPPQGRHQARQPLLRRPRPDVPPLARQHA